MAFDGEWKSPDSLKLLTAFDHLAATDKPPLVGRSCTKTPTAWSELPFDAAMPGAVLLRPTAGSNSNCFGWASDGHHGMAFDG